jgi:hypothetical protein
MTSRTPHDPQRRPRCPLCGSDKVREIFAEDDPEHRHVCMNKDCPKISSNRMRQAAGLPVLYPEVMEAFK